MACFIAVTGNFYRFVSSIYGARGSILRERTMVLECIVTGKQNAEWNC